MRGCRMRPGSRCGKTSSVAPDVIRRIDLKTGVIETVLGTGLRGDGPETTPLGCKLSRPHGLLSANGVLFVSDSESHRIRELR